MASNPRVYRFGVVRAALVAAIALTAFSVLTLSGPRAEEVRAGALKISAAWSRATPSGARVGGGYITIKNTGKEADRLVAADTEVSGHVEIHEMKMDDGIMKMRPLADGLAIPAGETVVLKPGGYHLMFMGLKAPLTEGQSFIVRLKFEKAGETTVSFKTGGMGARKMEHKNMQHMDHSKH